MFYLQQTFGLKTLHIQWDIQLHLGNLYFVRKLFEYLFLDFKDIKPQLWYKYQHYFDICMTDLFKLIVMYWKMKFVFSYLQ